MSVLIGNGVMMVVRQESNGGLQNFGMSETYVAHVAFEDRLVQKQQDVK